MSAWKRDVYLYIYSAFFIKHVCGLIYIYIFISIYLSIYIYISIDLQAAAKALNQRKPRGFR